MEKKYKSDISKAIHGLVEELHNHGTVDKATMRRFDASCLVPADEPSPGGIKEIRVKERLSQTGNQSLNP